MRDVLRLMVGAFGILTASAASAQEAAVTTVAITSPSLVPAYSPLRVTVDLSVSSLNSTLDRLVQSRDGTRWETFKYVVQVLRSPSDPGVVSRTPFATDTFARAVAAATEDFLGVPTPTFTYKHRENGVDIGGSATKANAAGFMLHVEDMPLVGVVLPYGTATYRIRLRVSNTEAPVWDTGWYESSPVTITVGDAKNTNRDSSPTRMIPSPPKSARLFSVSPSRLDFATSIGDLAQRQRVILSNPGRNVFSLTMTMNGEGFYLEQFDLGKRAARIRTITGGVDVKSRQSIESESIATLEIGSVLNAVARDGNWYFVELPAEVAGFERAGYVESTAVETLSPSPIDAGRTIRTSIGPSDATSIWIGFSPSSSNNSAGEIVFDDGSTKRLVQLTGKIRQPRIRVVGPTVEFTSKDGASDRRSVVIQNDGDGELRIRSASLNGPFAFDGGSFPITIPAKGRTSLFLTYAPQSHETFEEQSLVLTHNDALATNRTEIKLRGTVVRLGRVTGDVRSSDGGMLAGARVIARNVNGGREFRANTSWAGEYELVDLPEGTYRVEAQKAGFQNYSTTWSVDAIKNPELSFSLSPKPKSNRGELIGAVILGVLQGIAEAQGGSAAPPVYQPAPPPPQVQFNPAARCAGGYIEFRATYKNGNVITRRFTPTPEMLAGVSGDIVIFGTSPSVSDGWNRAVSKTPWGSIPPPPPGIPQEFWNPYVLTIFDFANAVEAEEGAGSQHSQSQMTIVNGCGSVVFSVSSQH